ncbi:hypothetical protein BX616_000152 [Lobosporangium transversale]|uniref:Uncharacterized protein n=1 Tax=Lobosporangium transversale TaxID=64571 RepID=A0A1Y2GER0_9FUNG|nr:hypothetical protein BCR41DRAFT_175432 [Lobosporangium transversale]KAF9908435.1 hypothetical protein BX616_000152 [Lobosporangium transversale]ORZ05684.1 hypothetical protein BCR41DRAFT_175432 [Lobosporangium transversale]|eukprot:XP_021877171.1 hypothetical protein BCR41DRAFT_175432 [Lobosporangium transversale]
MTGRLLARLKLVLSIKGAESESLKKLVHGYMFDAWSSRRCEDEFLTLNVAWPLSTDSYLKLVQGLNLHDELLSDLLTVTAMERARLITLILESQHLSVKLAADLLIWTVDQLIAESIRLERDGGIKQRTQGPSVLADRWMEHITEQERFRQLLLVSLHNIMDRLFLRLTRAYTLKMHLAEQTNLEAKVDNQVSIGHMTHKLLKDIMETLIEHCGDHDSFIQEYWDDFKRMDDLIPGFLDLLLRRQGTLGASKRRRVHSLEDQTPVNSRLNRFYSKLKQDLSFADQSLATTWKTPCTPAIPIKPLDDHQRAFISICNTLRRRQMFHSHPPGFISRLALDGSLYSPQEQIVLKGHIEWVDHTIGNREVGWKSCVKLKLQFFAIFAERSINETFADLICTCGLHWDLCDVLCKYLKRHRADPLRVSFETFQLGCELLLSVFSKSEPLRCQLRDHLFSTSSLICNDATGPLFGSWDFWRINIDVQLIAALNQLIVTEQSSKSLAPSHTVESLIKISLIAPYHVVSKIIYNAIVNRGQCTILLQVLINLGQLPWLRSTPETPTLLVRVLHDILLENSDISGNVGTIEQHYRNFSEFIYMAFTIKNDANQVVLSVAEFLKECAIPLFNHMIQGTVKSIQSKFFHAVAASLLKLYETDLVVPVVGESLLPHEIHSETLLRLLQLRTVKNSWVMNRIKGRIGPQLKARKSAGVLEGNEGDKIAFVEHMNDISRLCESLVARISTNVLSIVMAGGSKDSRDWITYTAQKLRDETMSIDLESQLMTTRLLRACQQHLGKDSVLSSLPPLPTSIWPLCHDHLKMFKYGEKPNFNTETARDSNLLEALLLVLDLGRMNDDLLADILQALENVTDLLQTEKTYLTQVLFPSLYRILSISSRSEAHRLLVQGLPSILHKWGEPLNPNFFWHAVDQAAAPHQSLSVYWDDFLHGKPCILSRNEVDQEQDRNHSTEEITLAILTITEMLLRFALEPLPPKNTEIALRVYRIQLGYDLMIDQISSLLLSAMKLAQPDWSIASNDLILYSFFMFSKMSYIITHEHKDKVYLNRMELGSLVPLTSKLGPSSWDSNYISHMKLQNEALQKQESIARHKARDEFVLAAMNLSDELAKRQDIYYRAYERHAKDRIKCGPNPINNMHEDHCSTSRENQGPGRGRARRRGRGRARSHVQGRGDGHGAADQHYSPGLSSHKTFNAYRNDDGGFSRASRNVGDGMDEGMQAWLDSIMATSTQKLSTISSQNERANSGRVNLTPEADKEKLPAVTSANVQSRQENSADHSSSASAGSRIPEPTTLIDHSMASNISSVLPPMLSRDQLGCLNLALWYLPQQEQQAVKSRISRLLELETDSTTPLIL